MHRSSTWTYSFIVLLLVSGVASAISQTAQSVFIAQVDLITPSEGEVVEAQPVIIIRHPEITEGLRFRILLDGVDVTDLANLGPVLSTYRPPRPLTLGRHRLEVRVGETGQESQKEWEFFVHVAEERENGLPASASGSASLNLHLGSQTRVVGNLAMSLEGETDTGRWVGDLSLAAGYGVPGPTWSLPWVGVRLDKYLLTYQTPSTRWQLGQVEAAHRGLAIHRVRLEGILMDPSEQPWTLALGRLRREPLLMVWSLGKWNTSYGAAYLSSNRQKVWVDLEQTYQVSPGLRARLQLALYSANLGSPLPAGRGVLDWRTSRSDHQVLLQWVYPGFDTSLVTGVPSGRAVLEAYTQHALTDSLVIKGQVRMNRDNLLGREVRTRLANQMLMTVRYDLLRGHLGLNLEESQGYVRLVENPWSLEGSVRKAELQGFQRLTGAYHWLAVEMRLQGQMHRSKGATQSFKTGGVLGLSGDLNPGKVGLNLEIVRGQEVAVAVESLTTKWGLSLQRPLGSNWRGEVALGSETNRAIDLDGDVPDVTIQRYTAKGKLTWRLNPLTSLNLEAQGELKQTQRQEFTEQKSGNLLLSLERRF